MKQEYTVEKLNFLRYIFISASICLALVFGFLWVDSIFDFSLDGLNQLYLYAFVFGSMAFGIYAGSRLAKTTFIISPADEGLVLVSKTSYAKPAEVKIKWNDISDCIYEEYGNGSILTIFIQNPKLKLEFTGSLLTRSADLQPLYELINANLIPKEKSAPALPGNSPTFMRSRLALVMALILATIIIILPMVIFISSRFYHLQFDNFKMVKVIWIYITGLPFIYYVWRARNSA
jgi:hypothetical protein